MVSGARCSCCGDLGLCERCERSAARTIVPPSTPFETSTHSNTLTHATIPSPGPVRTTLVHTLSCRAHSLSLSRGSSACASVIITRFSQRAHRHKPSFTPRLCHQRRFAQTDFTFTLSFATVALVSKISLTPNLTDRNPSASQSSQLDEYQRKRYLPLWSPLTSTLPSPLS